MFFPLPSASQRVWATLGRKSGALLAHQRARAVRVYFPVVDDPPQNFTKSPERCSREWEKKTAAEPRSAPSIFPEYTCPMIRQIAPLFFTMGIPGTLAYYNAKLGFKCLGTWQDPPVYAIVARDQQAIHFRCAEPPTANPNKYSDELLDAYVFIEDADALYAE